METCTGVRLAEARELFVRARQGEIAAATVAYYRGVVRRLVAHFGDVPVSEVTAEELQGWLAAIAAQRTRYAGAGQRPEEPGGLSGHTIDRAVVGVRAFFAWCERAGLVSANPARELRYRLTEEAPPKWVEWGTVERVLRAATHPRDYALLRFAVATGARRAGLAGLRVRDLDLADCSALVVEKGRKARRVYYDAGTRDALARWLDERPRSADDSVWLTSTGRPLSMAGLRQVLRRACERAGVPCISLHQLRHTMAMAARRRGVDPELLRRQLGHADIRTTYRSYIRWSDEDRREAFAASPFRDDALDERGRPRLSIVPPRAVGEE